MIPQRPIDNLNKPEKKEMLKMQGMKLVLSKEAMAKYLFCRDILTDNLLENKKGGSFLECSLIGITAPDQPNYVQEFLIPPQECTGATTDMDDEKYADWLTEWCLKIDPTTEKEYGPRIGGIWAHTHPGSSATPSSTDEETWREHYGDDENGVGRDFASMLIISKSKTENSPPVTCRVKYRSPVFGTSSFSVMPVYNNGHTDIPMIELFTIKSQFVSQLGGLTEIQVLFPEYISKFSEWTKELQENVTKKKWNTTTTGTNQTTTKPSDTTASGNQTAGVSSQTISRRSTSESSRTQDSGAGGGKRQLIDYKEMLSILVFTGHDNVNSFSNADQDKICERLNCVKGACYKAQSDIKKREDVIINDEEMCKKVLEEILKFDNVRFIDNKINEDSLTVEQYQEISEKFSIRRSAMHEIANKMIDSISITSNEVPSSSSLN